MMNGSAYRIQKCSAASHIILAVIHRRDLAYRYSVIEYLTLVIEKDCGHIDILALCLLSGGGQQTLWFAALDDRVNAAITSGYFYGVRDSLIDLSQNCACNFVPHFFETADMGELGALIAPRPFFVESGENDPLSGKRRIQNVIEQLDVTRAAYRLFGAEDKVVHSVHDGGHEWRGNGMREFLRDALNNR